MAGSCTLPQRPSAASAAAAAGRARHLTWSPVIQVTAKSIDQVVSAANEKRRGFQIQNLDTFRAVLVNFGYSAAAGGLEVPALAILSWTGDDCPTEDIHVANVEGGTVLVNFMEGTL